MVIDVYIYIYFFVWLELIKKDTVGINFLIEYFGEKSFIFSFLVLEKIVNCRLFLLYIKLFLSILR